MNKPANSIESKGDPPPWDDDLPRGTNLEDTDYRQMTICPECQELRGWCWQSGRCLNQIHRHGEADSEQKRWDGFDYNQAVTLCYCCGAEVLSSGSRWSVWFCEKCKDRAVHVDRFLRYYAIPIGRHSIMSTCCQEPIMISGHELDVPAKVKEFAENLMSGFDRMKRLFPWAKQAVRDNLLCLGLDPTQDVPLPVYLRALRSTPIDKKARFLQMCQHMSLPWMEIYTLCQRRGENMWIQPV